MRGCDGAEARSGGGPSEAGGRAAWRRAGCGPRPEEKGRPSPCPAPASARAALGPDGRPWECAAAGQAQGRGSGRPRPRASGRGVRRPPRGGHRGTPGRLGGAGVTAHAAATPAEKLLYSRPASVCRGGGGWAGARLLPREGAGAPGASSDRAPFPPPSYALARSRPENWRPRGVQQPRCQVLCTVRFHV